MTERRESYEVRIISAVMANVWTDSGSEPLKLNVTVAREMVGNIIDEMLLERGFEKFNDDLRRNQ